MHVLLWVGALSLFSAAAAMGVIAWRTARRVRARESARAELLKALAFPDASAVPASGPSMISSWTNDFQSEERTPTVDAYEPAAPIFAERAKPVAALPRWVSLAGVGAAMALVVALYAAMAGGPKAASATPPAAGAPAATAETTEAVNAPTKAVADTPIELIALQYRSGPAAAFAVSGSVRNPADGRPLSRVVAVVNLVDADGRILASQTTRLEQQMLAAGQSSAFSIVFPHVTGTVARYVVGFRSPAGDKVPHVDRRAVELGAKAP